MFKTKDVTEETKVVFADSIVSNNARGGGDVHGASSRAEITINAETVIVAENVAEFIDGINTAKQMREDKGEP